MCLFIVKVKVLVVQFSPVQSLSRVPLFVTPWITACQASLSITICRSSLKLTSIELLMPSSHLNFCHPLFLLPPIPPIQSCPTLCDPIWTVALQAIVSMGFSQWVEWVAIYFFRGSSKPRDWTWVSCIAGTFFTIWATRETLFIRRYLTTLPFLSR